MGGGIVIASLFNDEFAQTSGSSRMQFRPSLRVVNLHASLAINSAVAVPTDSL